jgi:hypothetical protein
MGVKKNQVFRQGQGEKVLERVAFSAKKRGGVFFTPPSSGMDAGVTSWVP